MQEGVPGLHVVLFPDEARIEACFDLLRPQEGQLYLVKVFLCVRCSCVLSGSEILDCLRV